jgi:hypothetical protein
LAATDQNLGRPDHSILVAEDPHRAHRQKCSCPSSDETRNGFADALEVAIAVLTVPVMSNSRQALCAERGHGPSRHLEQLRDPDRSR